MPPPHGDQGSDEPGQQQCLQDHEQDRARPDHLSDREVDVLRWVAAGLSNREIGQRLFISQNTVANHVRAILQKTGCANRTEAAGYAIRRGLAET